MPPFNTTCGPGCCEVSSVPAPAVLTLDLILAHRAKHVDGSCECDACRNDDLWYLVEEPTKPLVVVKVKL